MMYLVLPNSFPFGPLPCARGAACLRAFGGPSADDYFPPPDAKGGWRTLSDPAKIAKTAGVDKQKLDEAFEYVQNTSQHGGLLVVRHGCLVYERYFGRGDREALPELASCGKAFTSVAVTSAPCSTRAHNRATSPRAAASKNPGSCARQHAADKIRQAVFIS